MGSLKYHDIYLTIEGMAGADIKNVAAQSLELSEKLNIIIKFDFNGIDCYVSPTSTIESITKQYWDRV